MLHCHKHENQLKMRANVFNVKCGHVCIMDESRQFKLITISWCCAGMYIKQLPSRMRAIGFEVKFGNLYIMDEIWFLRLLHAELWNIINHSCTNPKTPEHYNSWCMYILYQAIWIICVYCYKATNVFSKMTSPDVNN